ncbi:MAG: hypothetical protein HC875_28040 [Anaerolineales bacterium]|nr:hypothetical protein [Anaerolineales bacterium]
MAILGNLEGLLEVLHKAALLPAGFWTWLDIRDLKVPPAGPGDSWIPDRFIWWWRGSRVLTDYTLTGREQEVIDEFPFFSFLLGDVHPHVLALPFVLLVVALALNLISSRRLEVRGQGSGVSSQKVELTSETEGVLTGEAAGVDYNLSAVGGLSSAVTLDKLSQLFHYSWSQLMTALGGRLAFGLYALAVGSLFFFECLGFSHLFERTWLEFFAWLSRKDEGERRKDENFRLPISSFILPALIGTAILALAGVLLFLPFYATFQSQARGMLPNLWNPTRLAQFLFSSARFWSRPRCCC